MRLLSGRSCNCWRYAHVLIRITVEDLQLADVSIVCMQYEPELFPGELLYTPCLLAGSVYACRHSNIVACARTLASQNMTRNAYVLHPLSTCCMCLFLHTGLRCSSAVDCACQSPTCPFLKWCRSDLPHEGAQGGAAHLRVWQSGPDRYCQPVYALRSLHSLLSMSLVHDYTCMREQQHLTAASMCQPCPSIGRPAEGHVEQGLLCRGKEARGSVSGL